MSSRSTSKPELRPVPPPADDALAREEQALASSRRHGWYAAYVGRAYLAAVGRALAGAAGAATILKIDLWNERLGGERDVLGRLVQPGGARHVGIDLSLSVCADARSRTAGLLVVQADIRALPFRSGSVDAVLDLSVLDHVDAAAVALVMNGYRRVLCRGGVLLVVFWQRSAAVRLKLWLKRALGRGEKPGQSYFRRDEVRAALGRGFAVSYEFAAGTLLVLPLRAVGVALGCLPRAAVLRFVGRLGAIETSGRWRHLLQHVAGLYGIVGCAR